MMGGKREGAGRKKMPETIMKSVKLTPEQWAQAEVLGKGNAADGIRLALTEAVRIYTSKWGI